MGRGLATIVVMGLLHLPLFLLGIWPLLAGLLYGWGWATLGAWILWGLPFGFIVMRLDRWAWWVALRKRVLAGIVKAVR